MANPKKNRTFPSGSESWGAVKSLLLDTSTNSSALVVIWTSGGLRKDFDDSADIH